MAFSQRKKQHFGTILLSTPTPDPPKKCKFYFYCRLAVSEQLNNFVTIAQLLRHFL